MATTASPDGVLLEVPARGGDSPSQERLSRIAALLRDADMAAHPSALRRGGRRRLPVAKH